MTRSLVLLFCTFAAASAADFTGTWKLNTGKSKYEGMPAPKEQTVTYMTKGSGYDYMAKGTTATGQPINSMFTYMKDGEEIKATGFPAWDAMVIQNGHADKSNVELKREGKAVGTATRSISADGKMMTIAGKVTMADGTKATYRAVYDKQ